MTPEELRARYGASEQDNYRVRETIPVPHPYCITPKHVQVAADQFGGMLGVVAVKSAEKQGAKCGICKGKFAFEEHGTALLVECGRELKDAKGSAEPELHAYLLKCKPLCEADKYVGFAFVRRDS
jgi:hypothetical protein